MPYHLIRSLFFKLEPERAHEVALHSLRRFEKLGLLGLVSGSLVRDPVNVMGLQFPNRVGLAAGLDKNGEYIDALAALGFGFVEIGTVTPRPQPGNPQPRLFRIPNAEAIINRMGFNNKGIDYLLDRVRHAKYRGILGINIGKNFDTPIENAVDDYLIGLRKAYDAASYITINVSSPNTKNLRQLQQADEMENLLRSLKNEQAALQQKTGRYVPLAIKIAPDLTAEEIDAISDILQRTKIDGVIATNTTIDKSAVAKYNHGTETGGLSGRPVFEKSNQLIERLSKNLRGQIPIIGVGGIFDSRDAQKKLELGASLVQVYTGFIYRGPAMVGEIARGLSQLRMKNSAVQLT